MDLECDLGLLPATAPACLQLAPPESPSLSLSPSSMEELLRLARLPPSEEGSPMAMTPWPPAKDGVRVRVSLRPGCPDCHHVQSNFLICFC